MANNENPLTTPSQKRLVMRNVRYLAGKALTIAATIFIGVFITVMIANQPSRRGLGPLESPFERSIESQIYLVVRSAFNNGTINQMFPGLSDQAQEAALTERLRIEAGLELPYLPRYLLWTIKALTFNWGQLGNRVAGGYTAFSTQIKGSAREIILQYLPHTLLLTGISYLLVLLLGMPISLFLARNYGKWVDKLFALLSPISSVPSWVFGILLIAIFIVQLHLFPFGGMFDGGRPDNPIQYVWQISKHLVLPVTAIVLSLLFQMIYAWRTFFIIYSEEDYVELGRAKGLSSKVLNQQYILRPALPYFITSFVTTLIGFWQLNMALESVFNWPGLGWLYIKQALPNFWGESMEPGELIIAVGIVVIFAYLLGIVVFALDLVYVIIDPRIRLMPSNDAIQAGVRVKLGSGRLVVWIKTWMKGRSPGSGRQARGPAKKWEISWVRIAGDFKVSLREFRERSRLFFQELRRYPSAIFGLSVILVLLLGSLYAVICLPYAQVGKDYEQNRLEGRAYLPRTAMPAWVNLFHHPPLLSRFIINQDSEEATVSTRTLESGWIEKTITFTFDFPYEDIPSEIFLYFDPQNTEKMPFVTLEWQYPDGRTLELKRTIAELGSSYDFEEGISPLRLLAQHPEWKDWFVTTGQYTTPAFNLLFAEAGSSQPNPQHGSYTLVVTGLLFEPDSDLQVQLVLLGQVYDLAGTDYARRDLLVPLFWGMPFALLIGLMGTLLTTLVAMLLPAIGVWFGGWVDNMIQRLTEINMIVPGLTIAVLTNVLFNINIWIILAIVVVINAFGSPIKVLRSALLQAREAPYIETARSYGASDLRIITRYLVPRIMPVLIPQLVTQVPSFIFWEATLGFFNIKTIYPSWGRIIYDGLAYGSLYGSPFWVLEPIFLLLLTSLAFAMLGSALERILNPRTIDTIPVVITGQKQKVGPADAHQRKGIRLPLDRRIIIGGIAIIAFVMAGVVLIGLVNRSKVPAIVSSRAETPAFIQRASPTPTPVSAMQTRTPTPTPTVAVSETTAVASEAIVAASEATATVSEATGVASEATATVSEATGVAGEPATVSFMLDSLPLVYTLHPGEFPYCIARRFDVDPDELLALNGFGRYQVFYVGTSLQIPRTGNHFPGNRVLRTHPATYIVAGWNETLYSIACLFGDIAPAIIAQLNDISEDSALSVGQWLTIP